LQDIAADQDWTEASSSTINQLMEDRDVDGAAGRITKEDMEIKLNSNQNKNGPYGPLCKDEFFYRLPSFAGMLAK
jgi:hypothetical protein